MTLLPLQLSQLRNATLADGSTCDVELIDDVVRGVRPSEGRPNEVGSSELDLTGFMLLPAAAEPHAHLDKALTWDLINPPAGDLEQAISSWQAYSLGMTVESIANRARTQALTMLRNGTTAIRCHVDILLGPEPLRGVQALVQVREELAELIDIELVALAGWQATDASIEAALDLGVDLVGGAPHLAPIPSTDLRRLVAIAERRGVGIDLHTDESLTSDPTIIEYARLVRGWQHPVSAGHCVRLGTLEIAELDEVITEILASNIGIISLPITNLYLQGWEAPVATPRGLAPIQTLLDAGVRVGAGADNVRDPFNPVGRSDALETASLLVTAAHLSLEDAWATVSSGARSVMSLPPAGVGAGVSVGSRAELLAVRGASLSEAIASAPADRFVINAGRLVSRSHVITDMAIPEQLSLVEMR